MPQPKNKAEIVKRLQAERGRLEFRLVAVAATIAVELELKARVSAQVTLVAGELDQRHGSTSGERFR